MFVLLLIEIRRSLFDDLHLNSDDRKRAVRSFKRLLGAFKFIQEAPLSLNLHINPATSRVDVNAFLCSGKPDYHTGRI
jgi:hypothetical protein